MSASDKPGPDYVRQTVEALERMLEMHTEPGKRLPYADIREAWVAVVEVLRAERAIHCGACIPERECYNGSQLCEARSAERRQLDDASLAKLAGEPVNVFVPMSSKEPRTMALERIRDEDLTADQQQRIAATALNAPASSARATNAAPQGHAVTEPCIASSSATPADAAPFPAWPTYDQAKEDFTFGELWKRGNEIIVALAPASANAPSICYMTCAKHMGMSWTMTTTVGTPLKQVCPICNPPEGAAK